MAKKGKGITLAFIGLFLGLLLGFSKILIELTVESLLSEILNDEARAACPCEFQADSISFSLLRLSGEATNARIIKDGVDQLIVPRLTATFNPLSHLSELKIALTSLNLYDPHAENLGPENGGFQFINELAKPLPPEKKKEVKLRIKLLRLNVFNGNLHYPIGDKKVEADGVTLSYIRDDQNNLRLTPAVRSLQLLSNENEKLFRFGKLSSSLYVTDDEVSLEQIVIALGESFLKAKGVIETTGAENISGHVASIVRGQDTTLPFWKSGTLSTKGSFLGTMSKGKRHGLHH